MMIFENKLFLGCIAWFFMAIVVGFLYFFIDFPGSIPLYVTISLWAVAGVTSSVTGLLVTLRIFEAGNGTPVALLGGLASGGIAWILLSRVTEATLASLIG